MGAYLRFSSLSSDLERSHTHLILCVGCWRWRSTTSWVRTAQHTHPRQATARSSSSRPFGRFQLQFFHERLHRVSDRRLDPNMDQRRVSLNKNPRFIPPHSSSGIPNHDRPTFRLSVHAFRCRPTPHHRLHVRWPNRTNGSGGGATKTTSDGPSLPSTVHL